MLNNRSFALNFMPQRRSLLLLASVLVSAFAIGLAAIYQPFLGLGIVVLLLLALGVTIKPDVASLAVFFILYTNAAAVAVRFHGVPSIVGALFLTLLFVPLGYYLILKRQPFVMTPVTPLLVVYLLIQMAGVMFSSENMDLALPNLITYITEGMLLFLLITNVVRTPSMLRSVIWVLLAAGVFMGSLSLFQYVTNTLDNNYGGFRPERRANGRRCHGSDRRCTRPGAPGRSDRREEPLFADHVDARAAGDVPVLG